MIKIRLNLNPNWHNISYEHRVKLATLVKGDMKVPFSIATTLRCRGGRNSISWIDPLYKFSYL